MHSVRVRLIGIGLILLSLLSTSGCQMMHDLQPHRLQRLNRGASGMPTSAYYSVSDPLFESPNETASSERERND